MESDDAPEMHTQYCGVRNKRVALIAFAFSCYFIFLLVVKVPTQPRTFSDDPVGVMGMAVAVLVTVSLMYEFRCFLERVYLAVWAAELTVGLLTRGVVGSFTLTPALAVKIKLPLEILAAMAGLSMYLSAYSYQESGRDDDSDKLDHS